MIRACFALVLSAFLAGPAAAQTQQEGEMRLYIQQLEERVRQLTGENERLVHEVNTLRASLGQPPMAGGGMTAGSGAVETGTALPPVGPEPQNLGSISVSPDDPLIAPDGVDDGAPVDLSTLAGGNDFMAPVSPLPGGAQPSGEQVAGLPVAPSPPTALSGSSRDEYDLAYGYILTGDYDLAEEAFKAWVAAFPNDPQASDAEFWLGESHLQQGEYRDAANAFLAVYKKAPDSAKGPDALLKLGVSLSALGEKTAACGTFSELGRRYPNASANFTSRVHDEEARAGC